MTWWAASDIADHIQKQIQKCLKEKEAFQPMAAAAVSFTCCKIHQMQQINLITTPESILLWKAWSSLQKDGAGGKAANMWYAAGTWFQLSCWCLRPSLHFSQVGAMTYVAIWVNFKHTTGGHSRPNGAQEQFSAHVVIHLLGWASYPTEFCVPRGHHNL